MTTTPHQQTHKKREEKELSEYASYWKNLLYIHSFRNINQHGLFSAGKTIVQGSSHNKVPNEYSMIALLKDKNQKGNFTDMQMNRWVLSPGS